MLVDGQKMLIGTEGDAYRPPDDEGSSTYSILHKPSHAHHMADIKPPPPPPPGAPPPAEEDVLLGRAVRNRHHAKKKQNHQGAGGTAHYLTPTIASVGHETPLHTEHHLGGQSNSTGALVASRMEDNAVHDLESRLIAKDHAAHMDGAILLHAIEAGLARQLRAAISHRRRLYGHTLKDTHFAFKVMDRDGNGILEMTEFRAALTRLGLGLSHTEVEQLAHAMQKHGQTTIEYEGFCNALHAGTLPGQYSAYGQPEPEPEPEMEEQHGKGMATAAALMSGDMMMKRKKAAAKAKMGPVEAARESKAEKWLADAKKIQQKRTQPPKGPFGARRKAGPPSVGKGVPNATARADADGKDGRAAPDAPKVKSKDLPRVHGLEVAEIVTSCGLDEAGGDLYLQAFQVLVDNNLPKPGTGVKEEQKDYNPMDFW